MKIVHYLNTTQEEIENKKLNIWIGISLGNKYFTKENIQQYILWALDHSKDGVMVVIGDALHAINFEVISTMSKEGAMTKAMKVGDEKHAEVKEIISELPPSEQARIELVRWNDITDSPEYKTNFEILKDEYTSNQQFRNRIIEIIKNGRPDRLSTINKLSSAKLDRLADYVLTELPFLVNGVTSKSKGIVYTAIIYPGISELDYFKVGLNNKTEFPELAGRLSINNKIQALEAYPD